MEHKEKRRYEIIDSDCKTFYRIWDKKKKLEICTCITGTGAILICDALNAQEKRRK